MDIQYKQVQDKMRERVKVIEREAIVIINNMTKQSMQNDILKVDQKLLLIYDYTYHELDDISIYESAVENIRQKLMEKQIQFL